MSENGKTPNTTQRETRAALVSWGPSAGRQPKNPSFHLGIWKILENKGEEF